MCFIIFIVKCNKIKDYNLPRQVSKYVVNNNDEVDINNAQGPLKINN